MKKLPKFVQFKSGTYWHVQWNPTEKKMKWRKLGKSEPEMYRALANTIEAGAITMRDILNRYQTEVVVKQKLSTQKKREWQIKKLMNSFGEMLPNEVTPQDIYAYHAKRSQSVPVSANREMSLLHTVFRHAIKWGVITDKNPAAGLFKNKEEPRDRYVEDWEYDLIIKHTSGYVRNALELAFLTGQRIGDVLKMKWSDICVIKNKRKTIRGIKVKQQKKGKELTIKISAAVQAILNNCKSANVIGQTVIADENGQNVSYNRLYYQFRLIVDSLLETKQLASRINIHDFRAKACSDGPLESELLGNTMQTRQHVYRRKPIVASPVK